MTPQTTGKAQAENSISSPDILRTMLRVCTHSKKAFKVYTHTINVLTDYLPPLFLFDEYQTEVESHCVGKGHMNRE